MRYENKTYMNLIEPLINIISLIFIRNSDCVYRHNCIIEALYLAKSGACENNNEELTGGNENNNS